MCPECIPRGPDASAVPELLGVLNLVDDFLNSFFDFFDSFLNDFFYLLGHLGAALGAEGVVDADNGSANGAALLAFKLLDFLLEVIHFKLGSINSLDQLGERAGSIVLEKYA